MLLGQIASPENYVCQTDTDGHIIWKCLAVETLSSETSEKHGASNTMVSDKADIVGVITQETDIIFGTPDRLARLHKYDPAEFKKQVVKSVHGFDSYIDFISRLMTAFERTYQIRRRAGPSFRSRSAFKGVIITGPPGCGKTLLARCAAAAVKWPSHVISCNELFTLGKLVLTQTHSLSLQTHFFPLPGADRMRAALLSCFGLRWTEQDSLQQVQMPRQPHILVLDDIVSVLKSKSGGMYFQNSYLRDADTSLPNDVFAWIGLNDMMNVALDIINRIVSSQAHESHESAIDAPWVFVLATCQDPGTCDLVRSAGRFFFQLRIDCRDPLKRHEILKGLTSSLPSDAVTATALRTVADRTSGFTPADLERLCKQIALKYTQKANKSGQSRFSAECLECLDDFERPSLLQKYMLRAPKVRFSDICGLDAVKSDIQRRLVEPLVYGNSHDMPVVRGILISGPSGVGKTILCQAIAHEAGANAIFLTASQLQSKTVGESEAAVKELFDTAKRCSPCIIIIDQVEALLSKRGRASSTENTADRLVASFLSELDGFNARPKRKLAGHTILQAANSELHDRVILIGTTTRPLDLDPAVRRPGRLDWHIKLDNPDQSTRYALLRRIMYLDTSLSTCQDNAQIRPTAPYALCDVDLNELVERTDLFSAADIKSLCHKAALRALRAHRLSADAFVEMQHFRELLDTSNDRL